MPETRPQSKSPSLLWLSAIYIALLLLLGLTLLAANCPLGPIALLVALSIAAGKAILIILYFMHVRYSSRVTLIFVAAGLLWLSILFTLTFSEYLGRSNLARAQPLTDLRSSR